MSEQISGPNLKTLLEKNYAVRVQGDPTLLPGEGGQHVFKVELDSGEAWTVRLGLATRPEEQWLAETGVLGFLNRASFPAPRLKTTLAGEAVFEWQPGFWAYALEYIQGNHPDKPQIESQPGPVLDLKSLVELGHLLGKLHKLSFSPDDHLPGASWLEEVPNAIRWAEQVAANPVWSRQAGEVIQTLKTLPLADLKALPRVLIHTDAHEGNLIWTPQGELYLLDWENAGADAAVIDLALVLSWLCSWQPVDRPAGTLPAQLIERPEYSGEQPVEQYDFNEEYCRAFLENYQQERVLNGPEREMLGPAIQFLDGWFAARNLKSENAEPGSTGEMVWLNLAFMRSVTPGWSATLTRWAEETAPA